MLDNLNLVDLKSVAEPTVKLIMTLCKGLAMPLQPVLTYLNGKAEANRFLTMQKAKTDAEVYHNEKLAESNAVLLDRQLAREAKRQNNIKDVAEIAAKELATRPMVSKEEVYTDWITKFINIAEDVSDDELKIIWGKILAGEVRTPGSYSLRTLETLKNLSRKEAELFTRACNLACGYKDHVLINERHESNFGFGMTFDEVSTLMEAGLLSSSFETNESFTVENGTFAIVYQDHVLIITPQNTHEANACVLLFTTAANEIYSIVSKTFDMDNVKYIASYFKKRNETKVQLAKIQNINENWPKGDCPWRADAAA